MFKSGMIEFNARRKTALDFCRNQSKKLLIWQSTIFYMATRHSFFNTEMFQLYIYFKYTIIHSMYVVYEVYPLTLLIIHLRNCLQRQNHVPGAHFNFSKSVSFYYIIWNGNKFQDFTKLFREKTCWSNGTRHFYWCLVAEMSWRVLLSNDWSRHSLFCLATQKPKTGRSFEYSLSHQGFFNQKIGQRS